MWGFCCTKPRDYSFLKLAFDDTRLIQVLPMIEQDLGKIESHFGIKLPKQYCDCLLNYPFSEESWAADVAMPHELELIKEINSSRPSLVKFGVTDYTRYFQIGSDGGEQLYYIDLQSEECSVYSANLEGSDFKQLAYTFSEWLDQLTKIDEANKADEVRMKQKSWWKFWD